MTPRDSARNAGGSLLATGSVRAGRAAVGGRRAVCRLRFDGQFDVEGHGESITSWNAASRVIQRASRSPHPHASTITKPIAESQSGAWILRVPHDRWAPINRSNSRNPAVGPAGNNLMKDGTQVFCHGYTGAPTGKRTTNSLPRPGPSL